MARFFLLLLLLVNLALIGGCASEPRGDQEFIPGKGWTPVK